VRNFSRLFRIIHFLWIPSAARARVVFLGLKLLFLCPFFVSKKRTKKTFGGDIPIAALLPYPNATQKSVTPKPPVPGFIAVFFSDS
jgi:hypothetical protein